MPKSDDDFDILTRSAEEKPPPIVHKYTTVATAQAVLRSGRLRFQSPLRYNDPFDSRWDINWPLHTPEAAALHRRLIREALEDKSAWPSEIHPIAREYFQELRNELAGLDSSQREQRLDELVADLSDQSAVDEHVAGMALDLRRRLRILCFSERPDIVTMWSHYADQHQGVVLGFDSEVLESVLKRPLVRVQYRESPPSLIDPEDQFRAAIFGLNPPRPDADSIALSTTKSLEWSYELEWRLLTVAQKGTLGDFADISIPPESLIEVTFGCRTHSDVFDDIRALALAWNPDLKFQQAVMPPGSFRLSRQSVRHQS